LCGRAVYPLADTQVELPHTICFILPLNAASMDDSVERRKLPRMSVKWPVVLHSPMGTTQGETRNITDTGACIECSILVGLMSRTGWR
jgi:hypothetical protein